MIGLGLVSFGRQYRDLAVKAIEDHCPVDHFVPVFDVSPVGVAKNMALRALLDLGCDWIILAEDDILPCAPESVTGYIRACEQSGYDHLMFHVHGGHNQRPRWVRNDVSSWPESFAPWGIYSAKALEACGLFDENFVNCWEHIEHSQRLALGGFAAPWPDNLDATGSEMWIREQPDANENSSIPLSGEYWQNFQVGKEYWRSTMPETYHMIWKF